MKGGVDNKLQNKALKEEVVEGYELHKEEDEEGAIVDELA